MDDAHMAYHFTGVYLGDSAYRIRQLLGGEESSRETMQLPEDDAAKLRAALTAIESVDASVEARGLTVVAR
jgi:hypothetical protein